MRKIICDSCNRQLEHDEQAHSFEPLIHVCEMGEGRYDGYADRWLNPTSGRKVHFDLCLPCYNRVLLAAYKEMKAGDRG